MQICNETGNEVKDVLDAAKERALKRGYLSYVYDSGYADWTYASYSFGISPALRIA